MNEDLEKKYLKLIRKYKDYNLDNTELSLINFIDNAEISISDKYEFILKLKTYYEAIEKLDSIDDYTYDYSK
jgi:hypothetical protein